jgi:hypothetical protein
LCWAKHQTEGETAITRLTIDARECNKALVGDMPEALPTTANPMQHAEGGYVYMAGWVSKPPCIYGWMSVIAQWT